MVKEITDRALQEDEPDLETVYIEEFFLFVVLGPNIQVVQSSAETLKSVLAYERNSELSLARKLQLPQRYCSKGRVELGVKVRNCLEEIFGYGQDGSFGESFHPSQKVLQRTFGTVLGDDSNKSFRSIPEDFIH